MKTLNYLYFQFSLTSHSIIVFIPVGLSLLLHLLQVMLTFKNIKKAMTLRLRLQLI